MVAECFKFSKTFPMEGLSRYYPTRQNLAKKMAVKSSNCPICKREIESTLHVLWECPTATNVWGEWLNPLRKWSYQPLSFMDLWEKLCDNLELQNVQIVAQIFRNI